MGGGKEESSFFRCEIVFGREEMRVLSAVIIIT